MEKIIKKFTSNFKTRFRDIDGMKHVNNAVFATYLEIARSEWYDSLVNDLKPEDFSFILARIEIDYLQPINLHTEIEVKMWVSKIGNKSWAFKYHIVEKSSDVIFAKARSVQVGYNYEEMHSTPLSQEFKQKLNKLLILSKPLSANF